MTTPEDRVAEIVAQRAGKPKPRKSRAKTTPKTTPKTDAADKPKKHAGGRPRKYVPAMLDEVLLSAVDGATWDAIGDACAIDPRTAEDWCNPEHPCYSAEFDRAVTRAKNKADNSMLTSLFHRGNGYDYSEEVATPSGRIVTVKRKLHSDVGAAKSWLANRIGWRGETQRVESDDPLLGILAAMRSGDDPPAAPEAD